MAKTSGQKRLRNIRPVGLSARTSGQTVESQERKGLEQDQNARFLRFFL